MAIKEKLLKSIFCTQKIFYLSYFMDIEICKNLYEQCLFWYNYKNLLARVYSESILLPIHIEQ